ncbi:hypothetical protein [Nitrosomonas sp.]|nr:hypothetical protein [Nitrosomonas sp.]
MTRSCLPYSEPLSRCVEYLRALVTPNTGAYLSQLCGHWGIS